MLQRVQRATLATNIPVEQPVNAVSLKKGSAGRELHGLKDKLDDFSNKLDRSKF